MSRYVLNIKCPVHAHTSANAVNAFTEIQLIWDKIYKTKFMDYGAFGVYFWWRQNSHIYLTVSLPYDAVRLSACTIQ